MTKNRSDAVTKCILLVAFGARSPQALAAYRRVENKVRAVFADIPIRWAFTSAAIRKHLDAEGRPTDSLEVALAKLMQDGITHVAVQALHVISGKEYHELTVNCHLFGRMHGGFRQVMVGLPLLGSDNDMQRVAAALISEAPPERKPQEAVVYMGHGTPHPANAIYTALMYHLQQTDPAQFVGTMRGRPGIAEICTELRKRKITSAYLLPCLAVAGNHALKDMAGNHASSWKSILENSGISCKPILKGLTEYDGIIDIWVDHLKAIASDFSPLSGPEAGNRHRQTDSGAIG